MEDMTPKRLTRFKGNLWTRYRIRLPDFLRMLDEQDHRCAICSVDFELGSKERTGPNKPVVDHCHSQGHVRGVLCHACNKLIGLAGDSPDILHRAIVYLAQRSVLYDPNLPETGDEETDEDAEKDRQGHGRI